jgi:hypothetical protein
MKSLLQRLPSKEKEWKAVARAKEKFYGDAFTPGDAKRCGVDEGGSVVVPLGSP